MTDSPLRQQIAAAIRDTPARYPDDIATAVLAVINPIGKLLSASLRHAESQLAETRAALRDVLAEFDPVRDVTPTGTGEPAAYRCPQIPAWQYRQWQTLAGPPAAHDAGPTVAECAADDRAHWTTKYDR